MINKKMTNTTQTINDVIAGTDNIPAINGTQVQELRQQVQTLRQNLNSRNIQNQISSLRSALQEKQSWLEAMRARKTRLQAQLAKLRTLRAQIQP